MPMISEKESTTLVKLLRIIAICGELSRSDVTWIGDNEESIKKTLFRNPGVLTTYGKGNFKSLRGSTRTKVNGKATILNILDELSPDLGDTWCRTFSIAHLNGEISRIKRNCQIARTVMFMDMAGIQIEPWNRPAIYIKGKDNTLRPNNFYSVKELKTACFQKMARDGSTRKKDEATGSKVEGLLFSADQWYSVYTANQMPDQWKKENETKMQSHINDMIRDLYAGKPADEKRGWNACTSAILFGTEYDTAKEYILDHTPLGKKALMPLDKTYSKVHYLPMVLAKNVSKSKSAQDQKGKQENLSHEKATSKGIFENNEYCMDGIRQLRIMQIASWEETLLAASFPEDVRTYNRNDMHGHIEGKNLLAWFDGNLSVLPMIKQQLSKDNQYIIRCFSTQADFLKNYFGDTKYCTIAEKSMSLEEAEERLGIKSKGDANGK